VKFNATHMHKKQFCYVAEVSRADGRTTYADIKGQRFELAEAEFDTDFLDLSRLKRYSEEDLATGPELEQIDGETPFRRYTPAEIAAAASPQGGYGKAELATLGITYPPKRGWQEALKAGLDPNNPPDRIKETAGISGDTALLRRVVIDIIEQGQAHLVCHIPGLLDRFAARIPAMGED
jgi:hypothetical protein